MKRVIFVFHDKKGVPLSIYYVSGYALCQDQESAQGFTTKGEAEEHIREKLPMTMDLEVVDDSEITGYLEKVMVNRIIYL